MKKIFAATLICLFAWLSIQAQSCLSQGAVFSTQSDINSFQNTYPGCHFIKGYVNINESAITSLAGLSVVDSIGGYLYVHDNSGIVNLQGLNNLKYVGQGVEISANSTLTSLQGLQNLNYIGKTVAISENPLITDLQGLDSLTAVEGEFKIQHNVKLANLSGLANLKTVGGDLYLINNSVLKNMSALSKLKKIGGILRLQGNPLLTGFTGLSQLDSVQGITVNLCAALTSFNGLQGLTSIPGNISINNTSAGLQNFSGLSNLTTIGGNLTVNAIALKSLTGLNYLQSIGGTLTISGTSVLEDFNDLESLTSIGGSLIINNNKGLKHLTGLESITSLPLGLSVYENLILEDFYGLENLSTTGSNCYIINNAALPNLTGLTRLAVIGGHFKIESNAALSNLTGVDSLRQVNGITYILTNPVLHDFTGLHNLQTIGNAFYITENNTLESLTGLDNLHTVGGNIFVQSNPALQSLGDFKKLKKLHAGLDVFDNAVLSNLHGVDSLQTIGGGLWIEKNPALVNLSGLDQLDSVGANVEISTNDTLLALTGLENLRIIGGYLAIDYDSILTDITSLSNLASVVGEISIFRNPQLSVCGIYPVCNHVFNRPEAVYIIDNAPGCNSALEVELSCGAVPVLATVRMDNNANCQADAADSLAEGVLVRLSGSVQQAIRPTHADGTAKFGYLNIGPFAMSLPQFPTSNWAVCQDTLWFLPDTIQDTIRANFLLKPLNQCPDMSVDVWLPPFFRGCLATTPMQVVARNAGTITAENVHLAVVLPSELHLVSSDPLIAAQHGDTLFYDFGDLPPFAAGTVNMVVRTSCDNFLFGQALCVEAFSSLSNACGNGDPEFSEIRLFSQCLNDTAVRFTLKNVGLAATQNAHNYIILEDEIVLMQADFSLDSLQSMNVDVPTTGATYRMEATKYDDGSLTATARENCGGLNPGFITAYWLDDGRHNYDFDCRIVNAAYDPNQKTAIPTGVGPEHLLAANKSIQYTIEFQNTGTDTAFRVLVRDVLSPQLNVNTFRPGYASHPYTWQILGGDTLEVLFQPIMLPDSNVNEAASHGWFTFDIDQRPNLPDGTTIENTASIIFDYNPPIVTNTVLHTIGKLTVRVDEPQTAGQVWQVLSNPARYTATFRSVAFIPGLKRFELSDALGRVVRTEHFDGQEFEFRRGLLAGGLYYFRIYDAQGKATTGKIILSE